MAEHGLTAKVIPEIDTDGLNRFINSFAEGLMDVNIPINISNQSMPSYSSSSDSSSNANSASASNERVEEIADGVTKGLTNTINNSPQDVETAFKSVTDTLHTVTDPASPLGLTITDVSDKFEWNLSNVKGALTGISGIVDKIESVQGVSKDSVAELREVIDNIMSSLKSTDGKIDFASVKLGFDNLKEITTAILMKEGMTNEQTQEYLKSVIDFLKGIEENGESGEKKSDEQSATVNKTLFGILEKAGLNTANGEAIGGQIGSLVQKVLPEGMAGIAGGIATGVGLVVVIAEMMEKFMAMLTSASPALRTVLDMVDTAVNLILAPVGTILAIELMPFIRDLYKTLSEWMGKASEIYEKEGWYGLIKGALGTGLEMFWQWVTEYLPVVLGMFWEIVDGFMHRDVVKRISMPLYVLWDITVNVIVPLIRGFAEFWKTLGEPIMDFFKNLKFTSIGEFAKSFWDGLNNGDQSLMSILSSALSSIGSYFEWDKVFTALTEPLKGLVPPIMKEIFNLFKDPEFREAIVDGFRAFGDMLGNLDWSWMKRVIKDAVDNIGDETVGKAVDVASIGMPSIAGYIYESAKSGNWNPLDYLSDKEGGDVNGIANALGLKKNAEGGIAVSPTIGVFGEAGAEAIIPLDRFGEVVNSYQSNSFDYGSATIINNWYISGANDPQATAMEVQHTLDKVVGKSYSKVRRW